MAISLLEVQERMTRMKRAFPWQEILFSFLLAGITGAVYWQACGNDFVNYDDDAYVFHNAQVQKGLTFSNLEWDFTTFEMVNWHPLTWLSFQLDYQLWGLNPFGFHFTNVVLHVANSLLLFLILKRMTGARWPSVFVAGLFALHPLHVESVAWVAERKDTLSAFFWMLTLVAYTRFAEKPHLGRYLMVAVLFTLGLMSKSMVVTLPCVLLLLDYWPLQRLRGSRQIFFNRSEAQGILGRPACPPASVIRLVLEKAPLLLLVIGSCMITMRAQHQGGETNSLEGLPLRFENALITYVNYLDKMFWPQNMVPFYPFPIHPYESSQVVRAIVVLGSISLLAMLAARMYPYLIVGWLWYLGTLVPVIGLVQVLGGQAMGDRYTYLPLIGIFIMVAWSLADLLSRRKPWAIVGVAFGTLLLGGCAWASWNQIGYWHNSTTLWQHTLEVDPENYLAHNNLGIIFLEQGKAGEALRHFEVTIRSDPWYALGHYNMGCALAQQGKNDQAIKEYQEAIKLDPRYVDAHNNLGWQWYSQGNPYLAIEEFEKALSINPNLALEHINLGLALVQVGRFEEAIRNYEATLAIEPDNPLAHNNLGWALFSQGKVEQAIPQFEAALRKDPNFSLAQTNLGLALQRAGKEKEAAPHFEAAMRIDSSLAQPHTNLALAFLHQGKVYPAIHEAWSALQADSHDAQANHILGMAFALQGNWEQSQGYFRRAVNLDPAQGEYYYSLAHALEELNQLEFSASYYRTAMHLDTPWLQTANEMAWAMAVQQEDNERNGPLALFLAREMAEATGYQQPDFLDTLAAALAETGQFEDARTTAEQALAIASRDPAQASLVKPLQDRVSLYKKLLPYREPNPSKRKNK